MSGSGAGFNRSTMDSMTLNINSQAAMAREIDLYYLHSADHPRLTLVPHPLIGGNFLPWRRSMIIALEAKNKLS